MADATKRPQPVDLLGFELAKAKDLEKTAREKRVGIEVDIIEAIGAKEEGATSQAGNYFKVTTTGKLKRTLIMEEFNRIAGQLGKYSPVKTTVSLDIRKLKKLAVERPDLYRLMVEECIKTEPAKTSVTVAEVSDED